MTYQEFCFELKKLREKELPGCENPQTDKFFFAMERWLESTEGGDGFFTDMEAGKVSYKDLLGLIRVSTIYE